MMFFRYFGRHFSCHFEFCQLNGVDPHTINPTYTWILQFLFLNY